MILTVIILARDRELTMSPYPTVHSVIYYVFIAFGVYLPFSHDSKWWNMRKAIKRDREKKIENSPTHSVHEYTIHIVIKVQISSACQIAIQNAMRKMNTSKWKLH